MSQKLQDIMVRPVYTHTKTLSVQCCIQDWGQIEGTGGQTERPGIALPQWGGIWDPLL